MGLFGKLKFWNSSSKNVSAELDAMAAVWTVFDHLHQARAAVSIKFKSSHTQYSSMLLKTNKKNGYLVLDELVPEDGNKMMADKEEFTATSSDHGIIVNFISSSFEVGMDNNIAFYKVTVPEKIDYRQRRNSYRVDIPMTKNVNISLKNNAHKSFYGTVTDISLTGMNIRIEHNVQKEFNKGDILRSSNLHLTKKVQDHIIVDLEVRHSLFTDMNKPHTDLGVKFVELNPNIDAILNIFVSTLQREIRRKQIGE